MHRMGKLLHPIRCSVTELVTVYQPPFSAGWPSSCSLSDVGRQLFTLGRGGTEHKYCH